MTFNPPQRDFPFGISPNRMHNELPGGRIHYVSNFPVTRLVIHGTDSPCVPGGNLAVAKEFCQDNPRLFKSAHGVADPGGIVHCVPFEYVAEHAPPNPGSIGLEMTNELLSPEWDKKNAHRWSDNNHTAMLGHAARWSARVCLAFNIPIKRITDAHDHGICGHVDVDNTFHESDHWDPGPAFPWDKFMSMVKENAHRIRKGSH